MNPKAGILVTGTEVITARISDRNGPWISERLGELGIEVAHILVVGDRPADLEAGLRFMEAEGVHLIVTSGGLGPTADDLTAEIVGRFAGAEMVVDEGMEGKIAAILERFARRFKIDAEALRVANRKQATIPEGSTTIDPAGTAPGLVVRARDLVVIVLPGPPRELHAMWPPALETEPVLELLGQAVPYRDLSIRLFGVPESEIARTLREVEAETDISALEITTCLRRAELHVDVRHRPGAEAEADLLVRRIREAHGEDVFSEDGSSLDDQIVALLHGHTIAVAESCTAGMLAARLTERPGASDYFAGGVVAYSNASKTALLGVEAALIEARGAVSREVAEAMAAGALERFNADLGIGITGIAGPNGGTEEKPVGYVCVSIARRDGEGTTRDLVIPGDRDDIRDRAVTLSLHMLRRLLRGESTPFPQT